jgi:hypothetical protein
MSQLQVYKLLLQALPECHGSERNKMKLASWTDEDVDHFYHVESEEDDDDDDDSNDDDEDDDFEDDDDDDLDDDEDDDE